MAGWIAHIDFMLGKSDSQGGLIAGTKPVSVWAVTPDSNCAKITNKEIEAILSEDRISMLSSGLTLGERRYTVIKDEFLVGGDMVLKEKTKTAEKCTLIARRSTTAIIILEGRPSTNRGFDLSEAVKEVVESLTSNNI
ncbi:profilin-1-like [Rhinoraja longicauda]